MPRTVPSSSPPPTRLKEYFTSREGIDREVITRDICHYLGNDALVRGTHLDPSTGTPRDGYFYIANRALSTEMIDDLKANSQRYLAEKCAKIPEAKPENEISERINEVPLMDQHIELLRQIEEDAKPQVLEVLTALGKAVEERKAQMTQAQMLDIESALAERAARDKSPLRAQAEGQLEIALAKSEAELIPREGLDAELNGKGELRFLPNGTAYMGIRPLGDQMKAHLEPRSLRGEEMERRDLTAVPSELFEEAKALMKPAARDRFEAMFRAQPAAKRPEVEVIPSAEQSAQLRLKMERIIAEEEARKNYAGTENG